MRAGSQSRIDVLIPTFSDPARARIAMLEVCLDSLVAQRVAELGLVLEAIVVDNGLTTADIAAVRSLAASRRLSLTIVPASPISGEPTSRGPAAARNAGLRWLATRPASQTGRYLLLLDDDNALAEGGLARLVRTLDEQARAVAVCPRIHTVVDAAAWLRQPRRSVPVPSPTGRRRLEGAFRDGFYDHVGVTAFGSFVTGRVVGLLCRQDVLLAWQRESGADLFFAGTPYGSGEDMLAMSTLGALGEVWHEPVAEVGDTVRATPDATRRQQLAWGYDHAWLTPRLRATGILRPGIDLLDADVEGRWRASRADAWVGTGVVVQRAEVILALRLLRGLVEHGEEFAESALGVPHERLVAALDCADAIMDRVARNASPGLRRPDLPPRTRRSLATLRDGVDALLGHIAGNALGNLDNQAIERGFCFGARQPIGSLPRSREQG